jgi:DNA polymerase elongation subunit (family B)
MYYTSYSELRALIESDFEILWVGSRDDSEALVRISNGQEDRIIKVLLKDLPKPSTKNAVKHMEATSKPLSFVDVTWHKSGWLKALRVASIYGINLSSRCKPGLGTLPTPCKSGCTMGYDIETSQHLTRYGSFPPPYSRITSIAIWCTCGYCKAWTTIRHDKMKDLVYCPSSKRLVRLSLMDIQAHMPKWLVGYNCYQFDNCSLKYHCPSDIVHVFKPINSGSKASSSFSFYLDLIGINNVDLYSYLDKCLRSQYSNLSLDSVAKHHSLSGKLQMPHEEDSESVYRLIRYNIVDSKLTAILWHETDVCRQVTELCVASCAPLLDCVRYVTGTMASCAVSSYCISNNMLMDWSQCNLRIGYEGGTVLEPQRSLVKHVTVCDFSSMYPTIMRDIGISPENVNVLGHCSIEHDDKILWWNERCTLVCIKGKIVKYDNNTDCMTRNILTNLMDLRKIYKKSNPPYSTALKVLANSLYGALGYANSPLHSPRAAATVTVAGRSALALAYKVFIGLGLNVVYGDTDSCFLAAGPKTDTWFSGSVEKHIDTALKIFHRIVSFTPFPSMNMEKEDEYRSVLLVDKKHYAYADSNGVIKTKGLSQTRKDRLGICRDLTGIIARVLLQSEDIDMTRQYVVNLVNNCYGMVSSGQLDMYSVSKEVRYEGVSCYNFTDDNEEEVYIPVTHADKYADIRYSTAKVLKIIEADINRLCIPAKIGCVSNMLLDGDL